LSKRPSSNVKILKRREKEVKLEKKMFRTVGGLLRGGGSKGQPGQNFWSLKKGIMWKWTRNEKRGDEGDGKMRGQWGGFRFRDFWWLAIHLKLRQAEKERPRKNQ